MILKSQDVITVISKDGINYLNGERKKGRGKQKQKCLSAIFFSSVYICNVSKISIYVYRPKSQNKVLLNRLYCL